MSPLPTASALPEGLSDTGKQLLCQAASAYVDLGEAQLTVLDELYAALLRANAVMNLTTLQTERDIVLKHFVDSLSLLQCRVIAQQPALSVLDLGTGGGFPALPLAAVLPQHHITAMDATAKKVKAVERMAAQLNLNITGLTGRAEELGRNPQHRETYDVVVTRAVASLPVLAELCMPFLKVGGTLLAMKADLQPEETAAGTAALAALGGGEPQLLPFELPELGDPRTLVVSRKQAPTPERFPRRTGIPNKRPLPLK